MAASVQDRLAMFGGHVNSAFMTLKRNLADQTEFATPYVEMCCEALKAAYPDLYGEDSTFDLMETLSRDTLKEEDGGNPDVALPLLTIGHLTNYMVHLKTSHQTPEEGAQEFSALFGDRNGMISALAVSSSKTEKEFERNTINAIRTAVVAGKASGNGDELVKQWADRGVEFPKSLNCPVLGPDGSGDLSKDADIPGTLAGILCKKGMHKGCDSGLRTARKTGTVVDFGTPAASYGKLSLPVDGITDMEELNEALPDIAEVKKVITDAGYSITPSLPLSFAWLAHDIVVNILVFTAMWYAYPYLTQNFWVKWLVVWPIWSAVFGTTLVGLWVLGHECGHYAFAGTGSYHLINDVVGFLTHTPLLVPFWAWRYSHHKHHMYTNHLLDGESHVPTHKNGALAEQSTAEFFGEDAFALWNLIRHLVFGWPMYLVKNTSGGRRTPQGAKLDRKKPISHFTADSQIFQDNQRSMIMPGTLGCIAVVAAVVSLDIQHGLGTALFWYWGPYLVVNSWLVGYTWLQHADLEVPHYADDTFTFMRGAISTIDRAYPAYINYLHHHIGSTHVVHHISFQVPFYRAIAATRVYKEKYPHLYRYDNRPVFSALWNVSKYCHFVESLCGIQYYKSTQDLPSRAKSSKKEKSA